MRADEDAGRAEARRLEAENPLWVVVFGVYSGEFVCFPRFGLDAGSIVAAKKPCHVAAADAESRAFRLESPVISNSSMNILATPHPPRNGDALMHDTLAAIERTHLERLKLAADILLSEHDAIPDSLEGE